MYLLTIVWNLSIRKETVAPKYKAHSRGKHMMNSGHKHPVMLDFPISIRTTGSSIEGNRDFSLKGHTQNLTLSRTQGRSRNLKRSLSQTNCCSWRTSRRGRRQSEVTLGTRTLGQPFWGAHSITWTLVLASTILEFSLWFISPRTSPGPVVCRHQCWMPQVKQLTGLGHSPTHARQATLRPPYI